MDETLCWTQYRGQHAVLYTPNILIGGPDTVSGLEQEILHDLLPSRVVRKMRDNPHYPLPTDALSCHTTDGRDLVYTPPMDVIWCQRHRRWTRHCGGHTAQGRDAVLDTPPWTRHRVNLEI